MMPYGRTVFFIVISVALTFVSVIVYFKSFELVTRHTDRQFKAAMKEMEAMKKELAKKDSVLLDEIGRSVKRIDEIGRMRDMNRSQIDSLKGVIGSDLKRIDAIKKNMTKW
jgi:hypothetical protein